MTWRTDIVMTDETLCFQEVPYGFPEYRAAVALRQDVLRTPLGLTFTKDQLAAEWADRHLVCTFGGQMVGCLVLTEIAGGWVQMRQVAVRSDLQGTGIGRALVTYGEARARELGFCEVRLHARETVVGFYERLGYARVGTRFMEITLPHWEMVKRLDVL